MPNTEEGIVPRLLNCQNQMGGRRRMQPNQGNDIIEVSSALERIGGDKDFLKELLDLYIEDFSEQYPRLEEALGQKDFTAILELGHCLKGSSANLSLNHLREHAYRVEKAGEAGNLEDAQTAAAELKNEFERLKNYLPQLIQNI